MGKGWDHRPHANGNSRAGILFFTGRPARRVRLAWLAYRMAMADRLFRDVMDPAVMDGLRWMLSVGVTDGELHDPGCHVRLRARRHDL